MADQTNGKAGTPLPIDPEDIVFRPQLGMILRAFQASPLRNTIFWLAASALDVIVATSLGQIILNRWNRPFYDAIERREGARAEAILREHSRITRRNLLAAVQASQVQGLPGVQLIRERA